MYFIVLVKTKRDLFEIRTQTVCVEGQEGDFSGSIHVRNGDESASFVFSKADGRYGRSGDADLLLGSTGGHQNVPNLHQSVGQSDGHYRRLPR